MCILSMILIIVAITTDITMLYRLLMEWRYWITGGDDVYSGVGIGHH